MKDDSPHGAQRLAEALAILTAGAETPVKPYIALGIASREHFDAAVDCAIETCGVSIEAANQAHAILSAYHAVAAPPLSGLVDMSIDPERVQQQLRDFGVRQLADLS